MMDFGPRRMQVARAKLLRIGYKLSLTVKCRQKEAQVDFIDFMSLTKKEHVER